jgi:hypothetical protein
MAIFSTSPVGMPRGDEPVERAQSAVTASSIIGVLSDLQPVFNRRTRGARPDPSGTGRLGAIRTSLGERDGRSNFEWLTELLSKWPNLYADTSALTLPRWWNAWKRETRGYQVKAPRLPS